MNDEIGYMRELVLKGQNNWIEWIKNNPEKTSKILISFYDDILNRIIEGS